MVVIWRSAHRATLVGDLARLVGERLYGQKADQKPRRTGEMTDGALTGVRVVELGGPVAAPYATKLLADLGADVIVVEPPTGAPARQRGPYPPWRDGDPEVSGLF